MAGCWRMGGWGGGRERAGGSAAAAAPPRMLLPVVGAGRRGLDPALLGVGLGGVGQDQPAPEPALQFEGRRGRRGARQEGWVVARARSGAVGGGLWRGGRGARAWR